MLSPSNDPPIAIHRSVNEVLTGFTGVVARSPRGLPSSWNILLELCYSSNNIDCLVVGEDCGLSPAAIADPLSSHKLSRSWPLQRRDIQSIVFPQYPPRPLEANTHSQGT